MTALSIEEKRARLRERLRQSLGSTGGWHPLSYSQEALWFLWRLAPASGAYNISLPVVVRGRLDVERLRRCWRALVARHGILRVQFDEHEGEPRQRSVESAACTVEEVAAEGWSESQLEAALYDGAHRPFDLQRDAAPRFTLYRTAPDRWFLLLVFHHMLGDLWSLTVWMDELRQLYEADRLGKPAELPPIALTYEDYVRWQRRSLADEAGARLAAYWRDELSGDLPVLDLPTDRMRPAERSFRGGAVYQELDASLTARAKALAASRGTTLFAVLLGVYQVLLRRYTGQSSLIVGTPMHGRGRSEFEWVTGDFVNILPLRAELPGDITFEQVLAQVRVRLSGAIEHQDHPFSLLVKQLQRNPDLSRAPIFQTSFVLQKVQRFPEFARSLLPRAGEATIPFSDLEFEPLLLTQQDGQFDLNLEVKETEAGTLMAGWKYSRDLFDAETVQRMTGHYVRLLEGALGAPERPVSELPILTEEETRHAFRGTHGPAVDLPAATSVAELFEAQAARTPDAIAVGVGEAQFTYAALAQKVTGYAHGLARLGVGPDSLVALLVTRGIDFIALMLAVGQAGGAFLPLDPRHPLARTSQAMAKGKVTAVVTQPELVPVVGQALRDLAATSVVVTPGELQAEAAGPLRRPGGGNLAYVMYTSGSTGAPKGAMVEHRGMVNHILAKLSDMNATAADVVAQTGPQSFDIVVWQCVAPLILGGRVEVFADEIAEDPARLLDELVRRKITIAQLVPSMLTALLDEIGAQGGSGPSLPSLRWMVPTGDALPTELCRRWFGVYPSIPLLNTYGSTECSDDQCHYVLRRLDAKDEAVPVASIGTPIQNMTTYVLDRNLQPVPVGIVGELYIGGLGVGRGYRHAAALTAAAFLPDPFSPHPGVRMYRSADSVRRRSDGNIDFLGRVDHMIKLRGFRIEPKEIEAALAAEPEVAQVVVLLRSDPAGEPRLVAYVVPTSAASGAWTGQVRERLTARLPHYMVPTAFCVLETLPLNANGKVDRQQLPAPQWSGIESDAFVAPRTPAEEVMAGIWAGVLKRERVGVTDDFFALGGDSIRTIQIVARAKQAGLEVQAADVFRHRTVAALCAAAKEASAGAGTPVAGPQVSADLLRAALEQVQFDGEEPVAVAKVIRS